MIVAHHAAVVDVLGLLEREVAATRSGATGADGAGRPDLGRRDRRGLLRPLRLPRRQTQLHTHLVISNKVPTLHDGKWRTLGGRPLHAAVVALS